MSFGDRMAPFKAADGLAFFAGVTPFRLSAGRYGSGEGALTVVCAEDGQVECKLTVSLAPFGAPPLGAGGLYVRIGEDIAAEYEGGKTRILAADSVKIIRRMGEAAKL